MAASRKRAARRSAADRRFVLSLGGSLIAPKEGIDLNFLAGFRAGAGQP